MWMRSLLPLLHNIRIVDECYRVAQMQSAAVRIILVLNEPHNAAFIECDCKQRTAVFRMKRADVSGAWLFEAHMTRIAEARWIGAKKAEFF